MNPIEPIKTGPVFDEERGNGLARDLRSTTCAAAFEASRQQPRS